MLTTNFHPTGRHFLQIPGPSPVPERVLRAMSLPTIDHRGPEFAMLGKKVLRDVQRAAGVSNSAAYRPSTTAAPNSACSASRCWPTSRRSSRPNTR